MAIFKTIGNAFSEGWNKTKTTNQSYNEEYRIGKNIYYYSKEYSDKLNSANVSKLNDTVNIKVPGFNSIPNNVKSSDNGYEDFENPFKLSEEILMEATKNYKFIYKNDVEISGALGINDDGKVVGEIFKFKDFVPSMFNPLYGINSITISGNTPTLNLKSIDTKLGVGDVSDCSIKTLVKLSNEGELGRGIYKYADFMYCKNLGKYSNNRLITLRKFPTPIGDDIWHISSNPNSSDADGVQITGDIGRMVTWLNEDNHIEDILQYTVEDSFREGKTGFMDVNSQEESPERGILGKFINFMNPAYNKTAGAGKTTGGNADISQYSDGLREFKSRFPGGTGLLSGQYSAGTESGRVFWERYDDNRVYEPQATTRDIQIYEGKLKFQQSFNLIFDYELRAYENINPRSAFLDLLNNIHQVVYKKGSFWGGEVWWIGAPENKQLWNTTQAFIDKNLEKMENTFTMLLSGQLNLGDFLGNAMSKLGGLIKSGADSVTDMLTHPQEAGETLLKFLKDKNFDDLFKGMIKNKLGRPALYAVTSILDGSPTGFWHVTIGNPRNPIMSMGNMIVKDTKIQHYGPLGLDDFPTGIKVTMTLEHAKARDITEIGKMYTQGVSGIGLPMARNLIENFVDINTVKPTINVDQFATMWASTMPTTNYTEGGENAIKAGEIKKQESESPSQSEGQNNNQQSGQTANQGNGNNNG